VISDPQLRPDAQPENGEKEDYIPLVESSVRSGQFAKRRYSWIARSGSYFLKIPSEGNNLEADLESPVVRASAEYEYAALRYLSLLSEVVNKPIGLVRQYSCIVFRRIEGCDLRDALLRRPKGVQDLIAQAIGFAADVHTGCTAQPCALTPFKEYRANPYLPQGDLGQSLRRTLVVFGFEARNFRLDEEHRLRFFDPHEMVIGYPEEDLTRFILSLLMLTWGDSALPIPWTNFDPHKILDDYRLRTGYLDSGALHYCWAMNVAMRRQHAMAAIRRMPAYARPMALLYLQTFFHSVKRWSKTHGL
jgi:hypothetical protein